MYGNELGKLFIGLVVISVIIGGLFVGLIWVISSAFDGKHEIASDKNVLYPTRYEIRGTQDKVDTTYYYKIID